MIKFEASNVALSEGGGYTLASCDPYWTILGVFRDTPGYIWHWTGEGWTDTWRGMLLFDRAEAQQAAALLTAAQLSESRIIRSVNLADYVRFDRRMSGYPLHLAGKSRHDGSAAALAEVYEAMMINAPQGS